MNEKIDKGGVLWIDRKGTMKQQNCVNSYDRCCDYCSHFGEPEPDLSIDYSKGRSPEFEPTGKTVLSLCHTTLVFESFEDERGK